ncbi:MAG: hydroxyacid dehydrogenase [Cytophagales bacterium]|nr:hydroxyacid dehydrogenase [Armatimonadota bacterium]
MVQRSAILVHPHFDATWPWAADYLRDLWQAQGEVQFVRLVSGDTRPVGEVLSSPETVERLIVLHVPVTERCLKTLESLKEAAFETSLPAGADDLLTARGVHWYHHRSEGFWGESVSEFGLALTLCGLRRIPQLHRQMVTDLSTWDYNPPGGVGQPGARGAQFGDDPHFTNGAVAGKRIRIVGAGNIASRYARFTTMLGAEVAAWDPFASEPCFHLAGTRRIERLEDLVTDAEIFVPMVPLTEKTHGLVTAEHLRALPTGCLVVLVTRAQICDVEVLRQRVLADEIALAADVFDREPLPLDDPLLGRHNVVHTPHNAGRTVHSNQQWALALAEQFRQP